VLSRPNRLPKRQRSARLTLTHGNVTVALVAMVVTVAGLSLGLRQVEPAKNLLGGEDSITTRAPQDGLHPSGMIPSTPPELTTGPTVTSTSTNTASAQPSVSTPAAASTAGRMQGPDGGLSNVTAKGGPEQVVMSWQMSGISPGQIRATITGSDGSRPTSSCRPKTTGCSFTRLTNGVQYTVNLSLLQGSRVVAQQKLQAIPYPAVLTTSTTRLWFNPADPANLTTAGGSLAPGTPVQYLHDQSAWHADAGVGGYDAPTISTINGHTALNVSVNAGMTFPTSSLPVGSAPSTVYAVAAQDSPTAGTDCFSHVIVWGGQSPTHMRGLLKGCENTLAYADTNDTYKQQSPTLSWRTGRVQIARADFTATHVSVWMDGASSYTWRLPAGTQLSTEYQPTGTFGASPQSGWGWRGRIGEVIVLSAVPTESENATIMRYLRHKWGL
jgi:hypothetical protein